MRIIPSILTSDHDELLNQLNVVVEFTDEVDIDVMDGNFVPAKSVAIKDIPVINGLTYNFDLMTSNPVEHIKQILDWKSTSKGNIGRIFVHVESNFDLNELIKSSIENNFKIGFTLSIPTAVENFIDLYKKVQGVNSNIIPPIQIMTVEVGKQGNPYHPEALAKIQKIKQSGYTGEIYVDGAVDPDIVMTLRSYEIAGVSVGSYISHSSDPMRAFNNLKDATWKKNLD